VVGGTVNGDFALARFNADGSPDLTFDGDGKALTDFGGDDMLAALAVQPDGKLVAAGRTGTDIALARYGTATPSSSTAPNTSGPTTSYSSTTSGPTTSTTRVLPPTTTPTTAGSPFDLVCGPLRQIRAFFAASPVLRSFGSIVDAIGARFGCPLP